MLSVFANFKSLFQVKRCLIDNTTFRLHYQFTFAILCICSLLQTLTQFFGKPIDCMVEGVSKSVFETFCWIHGTFTLPSQLTGRRGVDFPHPGVGPYPHHSLPREEDQNLLEVTQDGDEIRHAWYQWVIFVLFFQALLCYFPHFLWKNLEGGRISMLLQGLPTLSLETNSDDIHSKRQMVVRYLLRNLGTHNFYAAQFIFCEFLNLFNIIAQMFFMDQFFNGHFTTYGADILKLSNTEMEKRVDPMAKIFPKLSKCTFHRYGPSGTIVNHDGLCILPLNIINEKIYVFLWFWFMILIGWTCIFFCFRIVTIVSRTSRVLVFCGRAKSSRREDIRLVMEKFQFGDWFILMQLCKNMHPEIFHDLVRDLRDRMDPKLSDNLELRDAANPYPTLPLLEKPQAPYMETP